MDDHASPNYEQLRLFDDAAPPETSRRRLNPDQFDAIYTHGGGSSVRQDYDTESIADKYRGKYVENPAMYRPARPDLTTRLRTYVERNKVWDTEIVPESAPEEWIPTTDIHTKQTFIYPHRVEHMVENATATDLPPLEVDQYTDAEGTFYDLWNGNHRLNAALRAGQLLVPAQVARRFTAKKRP